MPVSLRMIFGHFSVQHGYVVVVVAHTMSKRTDPCVCVEYSQLCTLGVSDLAISVQYNMVVNIPSCHFDCVALIAVLCSW